MTIVIPYRNEVHAGLELKFALRSIEKYLTGWTNIVIIGDCPGWLKGINHIPATDQPGRRQFNIYTKLLIACNDDGVSDDFILFNDDHFLLKPLHVSEIKYWHNGPLENELTRVGSSAKYRRDVQNTLEKLCYEYPSNFDIHVPIIFNKKYFKNIFQNETQEVCIKSLYMNWLPNDCELNIESEFMQDCKIDGWHEREVIKQKIEGKLFFSNGTSLCRPTIEVLEELFPEKSHFKL